MLYRVMGVLGLSVLAGCTSLSLFYKEGTPVQRLNADLGACKQKGFETIPVDQDTRFIPGSETPRTFCDANGYCQTVWVQITPDRIETYDANEGLREDFVEACMAQRGYQPVRLPACNDAVVRETTLSPTRVLPPLSAQSCAIRLKTGQYQIVTPPD
ncbi:hypothetical protein [Roseovarius faecimaris]|nr:hypothetical protein [Roseovarius faecimaris]